MSFASLDFLLFLGIFAGIWPAVRESERGRWAFLTAASLIFYGWWDWRFIFLLIGVGLLDYLAALGMVGWPRQRRKFLIIAILGNLGILAFFKYFSFGAEQLSAVFHIADEDWSFTRNIILPVGISFYTFQSMSYVIDVYRGTLKPTTNILHFFSYLALFAQLVAGPIVRANCLLPQLKTAGDFNAVNRWEGCILVVRGFFKKLVIANNIAPVVNLAFAQASMDSGSLFWWAISGLFAIQIYCDFSGYSDIARGIARWMGYRFPDNFNNPYLAFGLRDFWQRWHISLSTWFRDYVYIPLGGSRGSKARNAFVLWATMAISGLWHGANWTFVVWGMLHGFLLNFERLTQWPDRIGRSYLGRFVGHLVTLACVLLTWVFFRADSIGSATTIVQTMLFGPELGWGALQDIMEPYAVVALMLFLARQLMVFHDAYRPSLEPARWPVRWEFGAATVGFLACIFLRGTGDEFIYFQF